MTVPGNDIPWVPLTFGRADVDSGASEDIPPGSEFGSPDHQSVLDYFSSNFGFSTDDTALILGAHTLVSHRVVWRHALWPFLLNSHCHLPMIRVAPTLTTLDLLGKRRTSLKDSLCPFPDILSLLMK